MKYFSFLKHENLFCTFHLEADRSRNKTYVRTSPRGFFYSRKNLVFRGCFGVMACLSRDWYITVYVNTCELYT